MTTQDLPLVTVRKRKTLNLKWEPGKRHTHTWQRAEKVKDGRRFYLHVCTEHTEDGKPAPVVKVYDMEVL